ncbi:hypothetical protein [Halobiforma nitratireducens]|uniref:Uncharacterized protein n=1 Tax=Halobiforma nitratireducens JCM 10879 TaxID=1227454 RepID=M0MLG8_9EURY|nr:hypothetical protein [Halobiforma nitratireducens]EMA46491.1 hypothetical protein C446_01438 [Halobiforma nitratireducens JCM 10879]
MSDNKNKIEVEEETMKLFREIAEAEDNSCNKQLLKMMVVYTTNNLISKTEKLQELLTEEVQET